MTVDEPHSNIGDGSSDDLTNSNPIFFPTVYILLSKKASLEAGVIRTPSLFAINIIALDLTMRKELQDYFSHCVYHGSPL